MGAHITRRDFLNGVSASLAAAALLGPRTAMAEAVQTAAGISGDYYPPTLTGLRGSHVGAFETSHALAWRGERPASYTDLDEEYDLVVVGAGISGLAAALFYQQKVGKDRKILVLENHDDFGGHAKRNEFHSQGQMLLGVGGSGNFQDAHLYSPQSRQLVAELGFDLDKLRKKVAPTWPLANLGLPAGLYLDRAHFGADSIINGHWLTAWHGMGNYRELVDSLPLPQSERSKLVAFIEGTRPLNKPVPGENLGKFLKSTSYQEFLVEYVGLDPATCTLWDPIMNVTYCVGADSLSIHEAIKGGFPGLSVLGEQGMAAMADSLMLEDSDIVWMPDGNASLTRQMVRQLIPAVAPGDTMEDIVEARFDYGKLDSETHTARLRLNSSVVSTRNEADGSVSVAYVNQGKAYRVKASHCILACYNGLIPHLCPELPPRQKEALAYGVKLPLVSVNVLLRNSRAFDKAGSQMYLCPTSYFKLVTTAPPVTIGNYRPGSDADSPALIYLLTGATAESDGSLTARDQYRLARHKLYTTSFEDYEREIRAQLTGMFGATGFDAERDIEAITINRWPHGYAYDYRDLFDPDWPEGEAPHEIGRQRFGRISIANSDSEVHAYIDGAIDAAWRAVNEQVATG